MAHDTTRASDQASRRPRRFRLRSRRGEPAAPSALLAVAGHEVAPCHFLDDPLSAVAAVEDLCWQFAHEDWAVRRPSRFSRADWRAWRAEERTLAEKRERIAAMVGPDAGRT